VNSNKTAYKDSLLGRIPEDWEVMPFGEFAEIVMGQSPQGNTYNQNGNGIALINGPTEFTEKYPIKVQWTISPTKICKNGDILLCVRGSSTGRLNIANEQFCIGRGVAAIRANKNSDHSFLEFQVQNIVNKILVLTTGSTFPNIDSQSLKKIKVALPPLPEQRAIAHVLSTMDEVVTKTNQLIAQKELRKKWLMQQLLSGRKRLKGFGGEWREIHIRDVADEISIKNKSDKQLTVLSCTKYDGLVPSLEYFGRKIFADDISTYKVVPRNHFAYATNHIEEGSIGYQDSYQEALISPMYTVFSTKMSINDYFFYTLLKSHRLVHEFRARMEGSIDRRGGLRWDSFSIIKLSIPSLEEQDAIAQVLQVADKEIHLLKAKAAKLKEQKKGMMQVLLTGKKRLTVNDEKQKNADCWFSV